MSYRSFTLVLISALTMFFWGCETVPKKTYEKLEQDHQQLMEKNSKLQKRFYNLKAQNETLRKRLKQQGESIKEFRELASKVKTDASGAVKVDLPAEVQDQVQKVKVDGQTALRMSSQIVFESGSATLSQEGKQTLENLAPALRKFGKNVRYVVEGHTDNQPIQQSKDQFPTNWHLSASRAISVARQLINMGMNKKQIKVVGLADTEPIASNESADGRRKNRRVEIIVIPRA